MISRIREMVALIRCVFCKRKSAIVRASALAMAFCVLLLSPAVPVRANALTDWEENLEYKVTAKSNTPEAYPVSVSDVTNRYRDEANATWADGRIIEAVYEFPIEISVTGLLQGAYNTGNGLIKVSVSGSSAPSGFAFYGAEISSDYIYTDHGNSGLSAALVSTSSFTADIQLAFNPRLIQANMTSDTIGFIIRYKTLWQSNNTNGSSLTDFRVKALNCAVAYSGLCYYTYSEEKALEYGVQLKRIEQSLALINSNITSTQLALSTAISNQTNALQSSISSAAYDLNNTLITWGGNITGAVNDFRQEILQYMEVSGSHDVIDSSNKTMDTQIKDYNKSESDLMSDASSKLDSVDTTDLSPLKAYEKATTFWTTAVRNLSESIGVFWYIYTFGAMIGLIAFILRLRG